MTFTIEKSFTTSKIPSGSGIIKSNDKYYVVGDDSPYLFILDKNLNTIDQKELVNIKDLNGKRIKKYKKPDFEAFEKINDQEFVIFGSGSKLPERGVFIKILLENNNLQNIKKYDITIFYQELKKLPEFKDSEINIEAAAYQNGVLYLFNRLKNMVLSINYQDLLAYFEKQNPLPKMELTTFSLPKINNIEAGFSGAICFEKENKVLFTASYENTNNAYDDGEILGSILGIIEINDGKLNPKITTCTIPNLETKLKVESVTIEEEISIQESKLVLITDDDQGNSIFINGILRR